jgi:two-component system, OmpR family, alkaline phosphatase synthesis response regulator PhoP
VKKSKILIVDDEPTISRLIEYNLQIADFETHCVYDGESVAIAIERFRPDLIVLDLMLPKIDGIQVCKSLRSSGNAVPIIMLTALQDLSDIIAGLDNGADDYLTKPFSPQELISRIQAILRRTSMLQFKQGDDEQILTIGRLQINPEQREVIVEGRSLDLTPLEFEMLLFMCKNQGKVLSRQRLLKGIWDHHYYGESRVVDVHISHLRDKIEKNARRPEYIVTIRNVGYKLIDPTSGVYK